MRTRQNKKTTFDKLYNRLKDNKLTGLTVFSYGITKLLLWSHPTLSEILCLSALIALIKILEISGFVSTLNLWFTNILIYLNDIFHNFFMKVVEPHDFIQWLTSGKFATNISCKEKKVFLPGISVSKCRRQFCRFDFNRKKMPTLLLKMIPFYKRFLKRIHVSSYIYTEKRRALGPPGKLIDWNATGIKFQLETKYWESIVRANKTQPIALVAGIRHLGGIFFMRVEALKMGVDYNMSLIFGKFHKNHKFKPNNIKPYKKGMQQIPICSAWYLQTKSSKKRTFTPILHSVD